MNYKLLNNATNYLGERYNSISQKITNSIVPNSGLELTVDASLNTHSDNGHTQGNLIKRIARMGLSFALAGYLLSSLACSSQATPAPAPPFTPSTPTPIVTPKPKPVTPTPMSNQYDIRRFETLLQGIINDREQIRANYEPYKISEKGPYETTEEYDRRFREAESLLENKLLEYDKGINRKYNKIDVFVPVSRVNYNADKQEVKIEVPAFKTPIYTYYPRGGGGQQTGLYFDYSLSSIIKATTPHGNTYIRLPFISIPRDVAKQYNIVSEKGDLRLKFDIIFDSNAATFKEGKFKVVQISAEWRVRAETLWKSN